MNLSPKQVADFWQKVDRRGPRACWPWLGRKKGGKGIDSTYGRFYVGAGKSVFAHRLAFFLQHGRFANPCTCHSCDNPSCVNPAHLFEGTFLDNGSDKAAKWRGPRKLTGQQVREIKGLLAKGDRKAAIARKYGVSRKSILRIQAGITFRDITRDMERANG